MIAKKILFWVSVGLLALMVYGGSTALQILPVVVVMGLMIVEIWGRRKMITPIMVISILMFFINTSPFSGYDLAYWLSVILVSYATNNK